MSETRTHTITLIKDADDSLNGLAICIEGMELCSPEMRMAIIRYLISKFDLTRDK